jgi:hydrogenase/urease accessory protein HupE
MSDFVAGLAHPISGADHILLARSSRKSLLRTAGGLIALSGLALIAMPA